MIAPASLRRFGQRVHSFGLALFASLVLAGLSAPAAFASDDGGNSGPGGSSPVRGTANLIGHVVDAENHPIAGAEVEAQGGNILANAEDCFSTHTKTGADGRYAFSGLAAGAWLVRASADHFLPAQKTIMLAAGQTAELNFTLLRNLTPRGAIAGFVRDDATSAPLAGAHVYYGRLFDDHLPPSWWEDDDDGNETGNHISHSNDVPPSTSNRPFVLTGNNGGYEIGALEPGDYYLLVVAQGHQSERRKVTVPPGAVVRADFRLKPVIVVLPGAIEGHVIDALTSAPLAGARVYYTRLLAESADDLDDQLDIIGDPLATSAASIFPPFVVTDNQGHYRIANLRPGHYHLLAKAEGHRPAARRALVASGATTQVDFALSGPVPHFGAVVGRVIDAVTTTPLAGARVIVLPCDDVAIANVLPAVIFGSALTDADGNYVIEHIPAGPVRVYAFKTGYHAARRRALVVAGQKVEVDFALKPFRPRGALAGTVLTSGTLEPIRGAIVQIDSIDDNNFDSSHNSDRTRIAVTDANGQYGFRGLPAGEYRVKAAKHGFRPARMAVTIVAGEVARGDFILAPIVRPPRGALVGTVIDADTSQPLAGAIVHAGGNPHADLLEYARRTARTDAQGHYVIRNLPAGEYTVAAFKRGYRPERQEATIVGGAITRLDFALTKIVRTGSIEGHVDDALTSLPLAHALVFVPLCDDPFSADDERAVFAFTDNLGHYRLENVPVGLRTVVARARGHFLDAQLANVTTSPTVVVDFHLIPWPSHESRRIRIRAIDSTTGRPLAGARFHLAFDGWVCPLSSWDDRGGLTNAQGELDLDDVPPGDWTLCAAADGFQSQTVSTDATILSAPALSLAAASLAGAITLSFQPEDASNAARDWPLYR